MVAPPVTVCLYAIVHVSQCVHQIDDRKTHGLIAMASLSQLGDFCSSSGLSTGVDQTGSPIVPNWADPHKKWERDLLSEQTPTATLPVFAAGEMLAELRRRGRLQEGGGRRLVYSVFVTGVYTSTHMLSACHYVEGVFKTNQRACSATTNSTNVGVSISP